MDYYSIFTLISFLTESLFSPDSGDLYSMSAQRREISFWRVFYFTFKKCFFVLFLFKIIKSEWSTRHCSQPHFFMIHWRVLASIIIPNKSQLHYKRFWLSPNHLGNEVMPSKWSTLYGLKLGTITSPGVLTLQLPREWDFLPCLHSRVRLEKIYGNSEVFC